MIKNDVAALFLLPRSHYKNIEGVDCYDEKRNALTYRDSLPVIAHPPCRFWSRLHGLAKPRRNEYELALWSYDLVKELGGILEHPFRSRLWKYIDVEPFPLCQSNFGHKMRKETGLLFVNCEPREIPFKLEAKQYKNISSVSKQQAMGTPLEFSRWLVETVRNK